MQAYTRPRDFATTSVSARMPLLSFRATSAGVRIMCQALGRHRQAAAMANVLVILTIGAEMKAKVSMAILH